MLVSANSTQTLGKSIYKLYPDAEFCSRSTGYNLENRKDKERFAERALEHNHIIICAALYHFNQTVLLDTVYKTCVKNNHSPHIIVIGSTTDRVKNGKPWLYNAEKKALRDYSNTLALGGVWDNKPKISYISFGTLSNNQEKHPERKTLNIDEAAEYIKWLINQPRYVNINEISIDPMQDEKWYD